MSDDGDPDLEYYEIQRRGALEGLNPMAGEWRRRFDFAPTSYSAPPIKRQDFKGHFQASLNNKFLFSHLVQVTLTLLLDEQTILETDAYGDLDNYAKLLNDALKGKDGLIIDDCQIHRLDIAWQDAEQSAFEVEIKAMSHDDFVLKDGLKLYAMRDGLYYPQAAAVWREADVVALTPLDAFAGLLIWETMTRNNRSLRHAIRQRGGTRLEAFTFARPVMPTQLGFHRSRALASGLPIVEHATWRTAAAAFNAADPEHRLDSIERTLADHAATIRGLPDHT